MKPEFFPFSRMRETFGKPKKFIPKSPAKEDKKTLSSPEPEGRPSVVPSPDEHAMITDFLPRSEAIPFIPPTARILDWPLEFPREGKTKTYIPERMDFGLPSYSSMLSLMTEYETLPASLKEIKIPEIIERRHAYTPPLLPTPTKTPEKKPPALPDAPEPSGEKSPSPFAVDPELEESFKRLEEISKKIESSKSSIKPPASPIDLELKEEFERMIAGKGPRITYPYPDPDLDSKETTTEVLPLEESVLDTSESAEEESFDTDLTSKEKKVLSNLISSLRMELKLKDLTPQQIEIIKKLDLSRIESHTLEDRYTYNTRLGNLVRAIDYKNINKIVEVFQRHIVYSPEALYDLNLASFLSFCKNFNNAGSEEEKGQISDLFLLISRRVASWKLSPTDIPFISKIAKEYFETSLPGLDLAVRQDQVLQILQMMHLNKEDYPTVITGNRIRQELPFPDVGDVRLINQINEDSNPEDVLSAIYVLTAPFKCSLGKSQTGILNAAKLANSTIKAMDLLRFLSPGSKAFQEAEWAIALSQFHNLGRKWLRKNPTSFSEETQRKFARYLQFRETNPVWKDKLEIYRQYSSPNIVPNPELGKTKVRVGISSHGDAALAFLRTGHYLTLHEVYRGNGSQDLANRSRGEDSLFLLSRGTREDPYVRYGAMRKMRNDFKDVSQYGDFTFILNPKAYEKVSATTGDSLSITSHTPYTSRETIESAELNKNYDYSYIEAQVHGYLTLRDIEALILGPGTSYLDSSQIERIIEECNRRNIRVIKQQEIEQEY